MTKRLYIPISRIELERAYLEYGMTQKELAIALGCSEVTIARRLKELGITKKHRFNPTLQEIKKLYIDEDKTCREIAILYKTTEATVSQFLRKNGVPPKSFRVNDQIRMKAYKDNEFMNRVNDVYKKRKHTFKYYAYEIQKQSVTNYSDALEWLTNEFYKYCVTENRLKLFEDQYMCFWLDLKKKEYIHIVMKNKELNKHDFNVYENIKNKIKKG